MGPPAASRMPGSMASASLICSLTGQAPTGWRCTASGGPPLPRREYRYFDWYGNTYYGWGSPGFYRGRYNGGSFGPCWTYTPIGMMPTCGQ